MERTKPESTESAQAGGRETATDDARSLNRRDRRALKAIDRKIGSLDEQIAAREAAGEE